MWMLSGGRALVPLAGPWGSLDGSQIHTDRTLALRPVFMFFRALAGCPQTLRTGRAHNPTRLCSHDVAPWFPFLIDYGAGQLAIMIFRWVHLHRYRRTSARQHPRNQQRQIVIVQMSVHTICPFTVRLPRIEQKTTGAKQTADSGTLGALE